jgi:DMSO/TMAO reductase YedYZ molybdopterin-dependent catalytic subunit
MKKRPQLLTRRKAIATGLATLGGLLLPGCSQPTPPDYGNILRMGDNLTYIAQRTLLPGQSLAREYNFRDISSMPATGTTNPSQYSPDYERHLHNSFADWRLEIEGKVSMPGTYSLADLQKFPSRTQITKHFCEEGWTAIAQWTGVPLSTVLQSAGIMNTARFVNFHTYDEWVDSIDLVDAFHPQTILAYGMNGKDLPTAHGAPIRVRVEKQIGYKSVKYIKKISVTEEFVDQGDSGWAWYNGI